METNHPSWSLRGSGARAAQSGPSRGPISSSPGRILTLGLLLGGGELIIRQAELLAPITSVLTCNHESTVTRRAWFSSVSLIGEFVAAGHSPSC